MRSVRRPLVDLDARGQIKTHGKQKPVRGVWHDTESHDSSGLTDLQGNVDFWAEQGLGYGAFLLIDKDGNSALCASPDDITWTVANHNTGTVSIELVGFAKFTPNMWILRRKQLDKLARWMAWIRLEYGIPLDLNVNKGWSGHDDQSKAFGGDHFDPGKGFPRRLVLRKARKYLSEGW